MAIRTWLSPRICSTRALTTVPACKTTSAVAPCAAITGRPETEGPGLRTTDIASPAKSPAERTPRLLNLSLTGGRPHRLQEPHGGSEVDQARGAAGRDLAVDTPLLGIPVLVDM